MTWLCCKRKIRFVINLQKLVIIDSLKPIRLLRKVLGRDTDKTANYLNFFLIFIDAQIFNDPLSLVIVQFGYASKEYSIANKGFAG